MKRILWKKLLLTGGAMIALVNLLPFPWSMRLSWAKLLYFLTVKGTLIFPSLFQFVEEQNVSYAIGKQIGESLSSILKLQKVLEGLESRSIPLEKVGDILNSLDGNGPTADELPRLIAWSVFGREDAARILRTDSEDPQTW